MAGRDVPEGRGLSPLLPLVERVPDGWSSATYDGRRYGVSKTVRAGGRAISVYAEELGGTDVVSTNVYLAGDSVELRPCEMPAEKVLAFLRDAVFARAGAAIRPSDQPE